MDRELEQFRARKDAFFRDDPESPLLPAQRRSFAGLRYYDGDSSLAFTLAPEVFAEQELVAMQTSTGDEATYLRWARIRFSVEGREVSLAIYRDPATGSLFLPFQDANAGGETYGAGRYLEVEELADGRLHVDFNHAYNPYCAYNDEWSCPIPLGENRLPVAIRAGEKAYH